LEDPLGLFGLLRGSAFVPIDGSRLTADLDGG